MSSEFPQQLPTPLQPSETPQPPEPLQPPELPQPAALPDDVTTVLRPTRDDATTVLRKARVDAPVPHAAPAAELPAAAELDTETVVIRGASPTLAPLCPACGGRIDADGYCQVCGQKAPSRRDHLEGAPSPQVAFVSDRGKVHYRNEDAASVYQDDTRTVLVVCDGVSTSTDSDVAAIAGADRACQYLATAPANTESLSRAVYEANRAVIANADLNASAAAAATISAALIVGRKLWFAHLGDSRIYWVSDSGSQMLTTDDSLAQELIAQGLSREEAEASQGAHAITAWLGPDSEDTDPETGEFDLGDGWVVVCSDGLWNYASSATQLSQVLRESERETALETARAMVVWASEQGGVDNISVALARVTVG
ncbi:MAG: serine/threonine-protein phosphatase [Propionibacteriaceae bacterium]|jgi:serine/threonine protein phosphatase PrpC|nr:serine/threonine-protein phosphatase [Propionibacteriaceae bacterium]